VPDRAAPPPEAGTPDFETPLDHESGEHFKMLHNGYEGTTMVPFIAHQAWRSGAIVTRVRLTSVAPESQDSGVRGYLPALGNVRKGEAIGDDGSPLSTTGLDTRRTTVPASPSAPSAREGERDRVLWLAKRLSWFDGLDEEEAIPDDFTLDMAWDHREPEARIICLKVAGAFVSEFERSLASRPVSGPGTVTITDEMVARGAVALYNRLHPDGPPMDRYAEFISQAFTNDARTVLAAALGGGE
jgi:hypothetical protein